MEHTTNQKIYRFSNPKDKLCAFAFKVVADPTKGLITFFRIYSGTLKNRTKIQNSKTGKVEKITQLLRMTADETCNIEELGVGDIGAVTGIDGIRSGDTFVQENDTERVILSGVSIPPPVFFCSIETEMSRDQKQLEKILRDLSFEDPSLTITENNETGQIEISGMGELHLEILRDRIELDYGIKTSLGTMRVVYRESIADTRSYTMTLEKIVNGRQFFAEVTLGIERVEDDDNYNDIEDPDDFQVGNLSEKTTADTSTSLSNYKPKNLIIKDFLKKEKRSTKMKIEDNAELKKSLRRDQRSEEYEVVKSLDTAPREMIKVIEESIRTNFESGPLLGYPVIKNRIRILDGKWSSIRSDELTFKECAAKCMRKLFEQSKVQLMEPYMRAEIEVPEISLSDVLSNISGKKGGKILSIDNVKEKFTDEIGKLAFNLHRH